MSLWNPPLRAPGRGCLFQRAGSEAFVDAPSATCMVRGRIWGPLGACEWCEAAVRAALATGAPFLAAGAFDIERKGAFDKVTRWSG